MSRTTKTPIRLDLTIDVVPDGEEVLPEHHVLAARMLREVADRIEKGADLGGFFFSSTENHEGGFALYPVKR